MITETGQIVAVESDGLWVETIQQSTCDSCAAQKGCGQGVLAKWSGRTARLRILLEGRCADAYQVGEQVSFAVPEELIAKGSLFVYLLPLFSLITGACLGQMWLATDLGAMAGSVVGLLIGGVVVRLRAYQLRHDSRVQPILLDDESRVVLPG